MCRMNKAWFVIESKSITFLLALQVHTDPCSHHTMFLYFIRLTAITLTSLNNVTFLTALQVYTDPRSFTRWSVSLCGSDVIFSSMTF